MVISNESVITWLVIYYFFVKMTILTFRNMLWAYIFLTILIAEIEIMTFKIENMSFCIFESLSN